MMDIELRTANRQLYAVMTLLVAGTSGYVLLARPEAPLYQFWTAVGAIVVALLWGGYFWRWRVVVDEDGIELRGMRSRRWSWDAIAAIDCREAEVNGVARCVLIFGLKCGEEVKVSSQLVDLEEMRELRDALREAGRLGNEQ